MAPAIDVVARVSGGRLLLISATFLLATLVPGGARAAAAAGASARPAWSAPFSPASPALLAGVQGLMGTGAGVSLGSSLPSLLAVRSYSVSSQPDLAAFGAISAGLPPDFEGRLAAALRTPEKSSDELAALSRTLAAAYEAAVPKVEKAADSRSRQIMLSLAYGQMDGLELRTAAEDLDRLKLFGPSVEEKTRVVRHAAAQGALERARELAARFLRAQAAAAKEGTEGVEAGAPSGSRRIPDDWKLGANRPASLKPKPEVQTPAPDKAEPPPTPPQPWAADYYDRLGATKEMSDADIKAAYRRASQLYHPDKHAGKDAATIQKMTKAFQSIQEAYSTLIDPKKRALYDLRPAGAAGRRSR